MTRVHSRFPTQCLIPDRLDFFALRYDSEGFRLYVVEFASKAEKIWELHFGARPLALRTMDEGSYLSMSWALDASDRPNSPIVLVTGSDFLEWFLTQSCGVYSVDEVKHVTILTENDWFEILCMRLPTIRQITSL